MEDLRQKKKSGELPDDLEEDQIFKRIKDIMIDCFLASIKQLNPNKRQWNMFEILGFDFIIDEDFRTWLLEVNVNPYMGPILPRTHPNFMLEMLDDTFKLTVDKVYHGRTIPRSEISNETNYELLVTADRSVYKRSNMGLKSNKPKNADKPPRAMNKVSS